VKIKIERSGGFAGLTSFSEMDANNLPPSLEGTVRHLLIGKKPSLTKQLRRPKGAADDLNYKITIYNGMKNHVVTCSELEMDSNVKSLVSYVEKNSLKK
jgi:hypothetical protein